MRLCLDVDRGGGFCDGWWMRMRMESCWMMGCSGWRLGFDNLGECQWEEWERYLTT